jgi:erythromycin esterase-like protein
MWRNTEVDAFVGWLRSRNESIVPERRAGFYGLDIYNMNGAIGIVLDYLDTHDPEAAAVARERYGCLTPWQKDPSSYGRAVLTKNYRVCENAVVAQCRDMLARHAHGSDNDINLFDAAQNARLVAAAERYYRTMYYGSAASWNLRDTAMFETLEHLLKARGRNAKAVVWAHNSHIGDARFTEMGTVREELNLGQLCRQRFGDEVALIGFGTHAGTVAAATDWDGDMEIKLVLPSRPVSYEDICHASGMPRFMLDLKRHEHLRKELLQPRLERFIGVIYRPETERTSHYMQATLPQQFDAFVWFDQTAALTPLGPQHPKAGAPETYPFGL